MCLGIKSERTVNSFHLSVLWYQTFSVKTVSNFKYKRQELSRQMFHGVWSTKSQKLSHLLYQLPLWSSKHFCEHFYAKLHNSRPADIILIFAERNKWPLKLLKVGGTPTHFSTVHHSQNAMLNTIVSKQSAALNISGPESRDRWTEKPLCVCGAVGKQNALLVNATTPALTNYNYAEMWTFTTVRLYDF